VVLLDEPTTGLDTHAEELVVEALTRLVHDRTVIMTTHRPAVTALATRTVHLRRGGVLVTDVLVTDVLVTEPPEPAPATSAPKRFGAFAPHGARLATVGVLR
jgi:energy-coupling factor transporter ATP-binding protein EcfA2